MKKNIPLSEQLRDAVLNCGQSQAEICRGTGIDKTALYRFVVGERFVSQHVMDILGQYLGLQIVAERPKPKKKKDG